MGLGKYNSSKNTGKKIYEIIKIVTCLEKVFGIFDMKNKSDTKFFCGNKER